MRPAKATMVFTTIFDSGLLDAYYENFAGFGRLDDIEVIVIPDRKTPERVYSRCAEVSARGLRAICPTPEEQEKFLAGVGLQPEFIPYNTDYRRNVGFLMAYARGADFLISIDDDNYCRPGEDFFSEHAAVCDEESEHTLVESETGFFNICDLLELERPGPVYPRGFPYLYRHREERPRREKRAVPVHVNTGLWLLDPDVDAITWLVAKPRVCGFKGESVVLGKQTWSPVNTQNTAMRHEAIPAYYYIRMGYPLSGMPIDRYGDIFSGYFLQACCRHLGGYIRVGTPVAEHRRNSHNYMRDAMNEWACMQLSEDLLPWLKEARLEGNSYSEAFLSLSFAIEDAVEKFRGSIWTAATLGYFHQMGYYMRTWLATCRRIHG
jgi:reversibly glycosylated polypeptide